MKPISVERTDPGRDTRRLVLYFGGLIAVYVAAVAAFWNAEDKSLLFVLVMFAPTVGALLARFARPRSHPVGQAVVVDPCWTDSHRGGARRLLARLNGRTGQRVSCDSAESALGCARRR